MKEFSGIDERHVLELFHSYRRKEATSVPEFPEQVKETRNGSIILTDDDAVLAARLARANTLRRKQFGHWERSVTLLKSNRLL